MTLQESMRRKLATKLGREVCPTCGHPNSGSLRDAAIKTGIPLASLSRFLAGGNADGKTLDAVDAFLMGAETAKGGAKQ